MWQISVKLDKKGDQMFLSQSNIVPNFVVIDTQMKLIQGGTMCCAPFRSLYGAKIPQHELD